MWPARSVTSSASTRALRARRPSSATSSAARKPSRSSSNARTLILKNIADKKQKKGERPSAFLPFFQGSKRTHSKECVLFVSCSGTECLTSGSPRRRPQRSRRPWGCCPLRYVVSFVKNQQFCFVFVLLSKGFCTCCFLFYFTFLCRAITSLLRSTHG